MQSEHAITRYYFLIPSVDVPVGGVKVMIEMILSLRGAGIDARGLHDDPAYRYPYYHSSYPVEYDPRIRQALMKHSHPLRRGVSLLRSCYKQAKHLNDLFQDGSTRNVFILSEWSLATLYPIYEGAPRVLLAQGMAPYFDNITRLIQKNNGQIPEFAATVATSRACSAALDVHFPGSSHRITLRVASDNLELMDRKPLRIVYMPRRRRREAHLVASALRTLPALRGVPIEAIDGVSHKQAQEQLNGALIFLSFSEAEGFGLPPAEAMASGCIVVGYTGVGGEEFFDPDYCFPIRDGDITAYVKTVEAVIREYRHDPSRLNAMRATAAAAIRERYSRDAFDESLRRAWLRINCQISAWYGTE